MPKTALSNPDGPLGEIPIGAVLCTKARLRKKLLTEVNTRAAAGAHVMLIFKKVCPNSVPKSRMSRVWTLRTPPHLEVALGAAMALRCTRAKLA